MLRRKTYGIYPEEIKQKEFSRVHKGLDETEVRGYLQTLSDEIEKLKSDKAHLQSIIDDKEENISRFKAVENTISDVLLQAQKHVKKRNILLF